MIENLSKTRRNVALGVLAVLVVWFCWTVRSVLNPLVLGYIFAASLHPLVQRVEKRGWSRRAAVNLIFAGFSLVLVSVGFGLYVQGRMMVRDVFDANVDLVGRVERSFDDFVDEHRDVLEAILPEEDEPLVLDGGEESDDATGGVLGGPAGGAEEQAAGGGVDGTGGEVGGAGAGGSDTSAPDGAQLAGATDDAPDDASGAAGDAAARVAADDDAVAPPDEEPRYFWDVLRGGWRALADEQQGAGRMAIRGAGTAWKALQDWFGSVLGFLTLILLLPIYTWFLLFELERIRSFVKRYLPVNQRDRVSHVARQIGAVLANFFRGRLLICFLKGLVLALGLWIAGIPYALLLGMMTGFLSLIPFVGTLMGFLAAFALGLLPEGATFLGTLVRAGLVFGAGEVLEGYVFVPKILGDSLGLHPMVVIVSVFAGGAAFGMFGLLLALPLTASLVILSREFVLPALAQFADEDEEEDDEEEGGGGDDESSSPAGAEPAGA